MRSYVKTIVLGGLLGVSPLFAQQDAKPTAMPAPKVDVYVVPKAQDLPVELEYPARIASVKNVTVIARVSGILQKKYFTEGASIHQGEALYKIEPDIYAADVASAKASLDLASSEFEKAQKNWERAKGLFEDKAISEQDKDNAYFAYRSAKASRDAAKAQLAKAQITLGYTDVNATIDGVAGMKMVDVGDYVKEGTPLLSITQTNPVYAEFSIPDINGLKRKYSLVKGEWSNMQAAQLQAALVVGDKQYDKVGEVDFIDVKVDQSTSTLKARALFSNTPAQLIAGEFVKVKLLGIVSKAVLSVPQQAVLQNPLGTIVFIVADGKVGMKPVKILDTVGQNFIVSGVATGDQVVVNNFFRIKPGAPVAVDKVINK